jgi:hypothetical protein
MVELVSPNTPCQRFYVAIYALIFVFQSTQVGLRVLTEYCQATFLLNMAMGLGSPEITSRIDSQLVALQWITFRYAI